MTSFKNEKYSGFGAALQKSSTKKKLKKEEKEDKDPVIKKKKEKTDWKKYFRLGSGGRSKTSAQE